MTKLLISDTADVVLKNKRTGAVVLSAETQMGSLSQTLGVDEKIFGGIGNKALATIRGQKEISSSLRNAFFELSQVEMTQGISVDPAGTAKVNKREDTLKVADNLGTLEVKITGTPDDDSEIYLRNEAGEVKKATNSAGTITVPTGFAKEGEFLSATYKEEVIGNVLTLSSETFSDAHTLEYHTIGYSPSTNQVVSDIYIQLDHVIPKGEFELSFENGSAIAPEFNFDAMVAPNTTEMGRIIEVART